MDGTGKLVLPKPANILTEKNRQGIIKYIRTDVNPNREMPVFTTMPALEASQITNHLFKLRKTYNDAADENKKNRALLIEP